MVSCKAFAMEGHSIFVVLFIPLVSPAQSLTVCFFMVSRSQGTCISHTYFLTSPVKVSSSLWKKGVVNLCIIRK